MKKNFLSGLFLGGNIMLFAVLIMAGTIPHPEDKEKITEKKEIKEKKVFRAEQPYIGEVTMFTGSFAPRGWALCDGQILPISTNTALFSIIGTTYGGDGRTTFALPDLRGRVAMHPGNGPGLQSYQLGQKGGVENLTGGGISVGNAGSVRINADNRQPFVTVNYIIALQGLYPSRS